MKRKRGEAFSRIANFRFQDPSSPSQKIYPIFLHRTSHVSRLKSSCLRNRDKKVALTVARGKTRWLAKTNVQSPSKKIQYPTPLKKGGGEEKERNERRKRIFSPNVENRTFEQWYTLLTRHTRDKQRQKKYSPTREGGEGVSGARFKPGSNRIRAYRCPGVCQKREGNSVSIMIRRERERGKAASIRSIYPPSQHPWKRSRLNPSLIVLHSSQDIVRIVICTPDKVSAHSRSYWAEHHHHHRHRHHHHHAAFYTVAHYEKFHDVRKYWLARALDIRLRSS